MGRPFLRAEHGNIAMLFALVLPLLLLAGAISVDYLGSIRQREALQAAADSISLRSAREFLLQNASKSQVEAAAQSHAAAMREKIGPFKFSVKADAKDNSVSVMLIQDGHKSSLVPAGIGAKEAKAESTAVVRGASNVCVIALQKSGRHAVSTKDAARLDATDCAVISNSTDKAGIAAESLSTIDANFICSAGGYKGGPMNYPKAPLTDCPAVEDPLKDRPPPPSGACDFNNFSVGSNGSIGHLLDATLEPIVAIIDASNPAPLADRTRYDLEPGVYCGGLRLKPTADARLAPGVYVIRGGPLVVEKGARLLGVNVGFYLEDDDALIEFSRAAIVHLTAPKDGPMGGLLMYQNREAKGSKAHLIMSSNVRTLLGTIYLPEATLEISTSYPVADKSAYTAIVAKSLALAGSTKVTLNTDYAATDVPTPSGIGPTGGEVVLRN